MVAVRLLPMGETALLAEVASGDEALALALAVERVRRRGGREGTGDDEAAGPDDEAGAAAATGGEWAGVLEVVPGARTVLVRVDHPLRLSAVGAALTRLAAPLRAESPPAPAGSVVVEVVYDGPDLAEVGRLTGLGAAGVVAAHTGSVWRVAFGGFAPGFAYLAGGDPRLEVPRRAEPRTRVPAGAVGLAGPFSGIYPRESPGGWQLLGRTGAPLWDAQRDPPALLRPGASVRFVAVAPDRATGALP